MSALFLHAAYAVPTPVGVNLIATWQFNKARGRPHARGGEPNDPG